MKDYKQVTESVFRKSEERMKIAEKRRAVIRRTVYAVSGMCVAVIIGVGLWKNAAIKDAFRKDFHSSSIIEETSESASAENTELSTFFEVTAVSDSRETVTTPVTSSAEPQQSNKPVATETLKDESIAVTVTVTYPGNDRLSETSSTALQQSPNDPVVTETTKDESLAVAPPYYENTKSSETTFADLQSSIVFISSDNTVTDIQTSYMQHVTSTKEIVSQLQPDTETTNTAAENMTFTSTEQPKTTAMDMTMPVTENSSSTGEAMGESTAFFILNGTEYTYSSKTLDKAYIGSFYREVPFSHETAKAYMINDMPEEAALAVEFDGNGICYIYRNKRYKSESLKAMIKDFSLDTQIKSGNAVCDVWGETYRYNFVFTDKLLNILLKYSVLPSDAAPKRLERDYFKLTTYYPILENYFSVFISSNGYIYVELADWKSNFYIGSDEAFSLIERMLSVVKSGYG